MKLLIFGPPGSGKGTLSDQFSVSTGVKHVSTGDIFREHIKAQDDLGKKILQINKGGLVPDSLTNEIVEDRLSQEDVKDSFILDGYPRTVDQALFLEQISNISGVIFVDLEDEAIINRISHRRVCPHDGKIYHLDYKKPKVEGICDNCGSAIIQREDDKPDIVKERLEVYKDKTHPLLELFEQQGLPVLHIRGDYNINTETQGIIDKIVNWQRVLINN